MKRRRKGGYAAQNIIKPDGVTVEMPITKEEVNMVVDAYMMYGNNAGC